MLKTEQDVQRAIEQADPGLVDHGTLDAAQWSAPVELIEGDLADAIEPPADGWEIDAHTQRILDDPDIDRSE